MSKPYINDCDKQLLTHMSLRTKKPPDINVSMTEEPELLNSAPETRC